MSNALSETRTSIAAVVLFGAASILLMATGGIVALSLRFLVLRREARGTSERTVRQQAQSLYTKAGLAGRSELAAFFLEDLLLPHERPE